MSVMMGAELAAAQAANFKLLSGKMVLIQGGNFLMGSTVTPHSQPIHRVTISPFLIGENPVTNDEYYRSSDFLKGRRVALIGTDPMTGRLRLFALGENKGELREAVDKIPLVKIFPSIGDTLTLGGIGFFKKLSARVEKCTKALDESMTVTIRDHKPERGFDRPMQPAVDVNWYEALVYALLHGANLPTEWQWEYVARFVLGQERLRDFAAPRDKLIKDEIHFDATTTVDVDDMRYPTLGNGVRHLTGNVWEWMLNWFGKYPEGPVTDPTGPINGEQKVLRGGSWDDFKAEVLHASNRLPVFPIGHDDSVGFRLVASPPVR